MKNSRVFKSLIIVLLSVVMCCSILVGCISNTGEIITITFYDGETVYETIDIDDETQTITFPIAPTKQGHEFAGWFFDNNTFEDELIEGTIVGDISDRKENKNTEIETDNGNENTETNEKQLSDDNVNIASVEINVYAKWIVNANMITFNPNYQDGGAEYTQNISTGDTEALKVMSFEREGHTFIEWNTLKDGTGDGYENGAEYTILFAGDVELYAIWAEKEKEYSEYKEEIYKENIDGTYDIVTTTKTGLVSAKAEMQPSVINGFTFNATGSVLSGNITKDEMLVLKVYYTRNNYTITFKNYDGIVIQSKVMKYSETLIFDGAEPTRDATVQINFITINGIMKSREPTSVDQGETKLKKENRTIDGTLVVDIIAIKNKVKVTWDYITSEDMARLQSAIAKSDFVEVEYNDSKGMMTIVA